MKTIRILSALTALMGIVHICATFSPLISGKLGCLDAGTYNAMIYMSLMCGLLLVVLGGFIWWAVGRVAEHLLLKPMLTVASLLLLADGVLAVIFMPHNPCAWVILLLSLLLNMFGTKRLMTPR